MAHVTGYPTEYSARKSIYTLIFMTALAVAIGIITFDQTGDRKHEIMVSAAISVGIMMVMFFVYRRIDPFCFMKIFRPEMFRSHMIRNIAVADALGTLDERFHIFHRFIFELFTVEHLAVSESGIFVIAKIEEYGDVHEREGILYCGDRSLETISSNCWRVCHLISIMLRKYFSTEFLPTPILVSPAPLKEKVKEINSLYITDIDSLAQFIESRNDNALDTETALSFAGFIKNRYVKKM